MVSSGDFGFGAIGDANGLIISKFETAVISLLCASGGHMTNVNLGRRIDDC